MSGFTQYGRIGLPVIYNSLPSASAGLNGTYAKVGDTTYYCDGTQWKVVTQSLQIFEIVATDGTTAGSGTFDKTTAEIISAIQSDKQLVVKKTTNGEVYFPIIAKTDGTNLQLVFAHFLQNNAGNKITQITMDYDATNSVYQEHTTELPKLQFSVMPNPSAELVGNIVQYVGATTATEPIYINGFWYECVEDASTTPSTYSFSQKNIQPAGSSINVIDNLSSTSATDALSANQGRILDENKQPLIYLQLATPTGASEKSLWVKNEVVEEVKFLGEVVTSLTYYKNLGSFVIRTGSSEKIYSKDFYKAINGSITSTGYTDGGGNTTTYEDMTPVFVENLIVNGDVEIIAKTNWSLIDSSDPTGLFAYDDDTGHFAYKTLWTFTSNNLQFASVGWFDGRLHNWESLSTAVVSGWVSSGFVGTSDFANMTFAYFTKADSTSRFGWHEHLTRTTENAYKLYTYDNNSWVGITAAGQEPIDNLESTSTTKPLSANQGRILNTFKVDRVTEMPEITQTMVDDRRIYLYAGNDTLEFIHGYYYEPQLVAGSFEYVRINTQPETTINDSLTSTATGEALSANQGKVLNDGKVNKITIADSSIRVYTSTNQVQGDIVADTTKTNGTIALRTDTGQVKVNTPVANDDATTKEYVDDEIIKAKSSAFRFVGYIKDSEPTATKSGELWYASNTMPTTFPIQVHTYDGTSWSATTSEYTPSNFETWANLIDNHGYYWFANGWNIIDATGAILVDGVTIDKNASNQLEVKDGGLTTTKFNSGSISTSIPSSGAVDTKVVTEKAVKTYFDANTIRLSNVSGASRSSLAALITASTGAICLYSLTFTAGESPDLSAYTAWTGLLIKEYIDFYTLQVHSTADGSVYNCHCNNGTWGSWKQVSNVISNAVETTVSALFDMCVNNSSLVVPNVTFAEGSQPTGESASTSYLVTIVKNNSGNGYMFLKKEANSKMYYKYNDGTTWSAWYELITGAGGALKGAIVKQRGSGAEDLAIQMSDDTGRLLFEGGSGWSKGGMLLVNGKDAANDPGCVDLRGSNGTSTTKLVVSPTEIKATKSGGTGQQLFPAKILSATAGANLSIGRPHFYQVGNMVFVNCVLEFSAAVNAWSDILTGLPKAAMIDQYFACWRYDTNGRYDIYVDPSYNKFMSPNTIASGTKLICSFQYLTNEA